MRSDFVARWFTVPEAAKRAGVSKRLMQKRVSEGRITYHRDGRKVLIHDDDLRRYLESRKVPARYDRRRRA